MGQFLCLYEETTRGTQPGSPTRMFYPVIKGLAPKFKATDQPRKEFKGANTALGDSTVQRKESIFTFAPEMYIYPGKEINLKLKHLLGFSGIRATVDVSGKKGIFYPLTMPYGSGANLGDKAIGLEPNIDRDGATKSQVWGGWRPKSGTITIKPPEDVTIAFDGQGPGPFVGDPNQAETASTLFPSSTPFSYSDVKYYIGAGASRTGTAPDFTDLAVGTMNQFKPDNMTIKITNGLDDKFQGDGVRGPTKSERTSQFMVEIDFEIDFRDPASGFSSIDQFESLFEGPQTTSLMVVLDNGQLAGATTENYKWVIDVPLAQVECDSPDPDNEGKQVKAKYKLTRLFDSAVGYPIAIMTVDTAA